MTFGQPQGLWLLLLGLPIIGFHFYKGRIRRMPVPTLLFWEQVLVEEERRTALKKLKHLASLALNLAALFILTSAVAEPNVKGLSRPRQRFALVLDNTASMGALEANGRSRLAGAVEQARAFIRTLAFGDQVSVHDLSGGRRPFTSDLERRIGELTAPPPAAGGDLREHILSALAAGDDVTAVLYTDRPPEGVDDLLANGRLRVARVGTPLENAGWVAGLPVRRAGEKKVSLSVTAANFSARPARREAVLLFNQQELERRAIELAPDGRVTVDWAIDPARHSGRGIEDGGIVEAALEPRDSFALDDVASFVLPPLGPPAVIVFHGGSPDEFLMRALHSLHAAGICRRPGAAPVDRYAAVRSQIAEGVVVVFDRVRPPAPLGWGGYLIIGAPGEGTVARPTLADWDREAPPNRLVDYAGIAVRKSRLLEGRPLIRAVEGPLATWSSQGGRAVVEIGFALEDSDIKQFAAFPMLLFNFVEWAAWRGTRAFRAEYRVGEPLRPENDLWIDEGDLMFEGSGGVDRATIRRSRPETVPRSGPGFVRIGAGERSEHVAVNLFDPAESDLREPAARVAGFPLPPPAPWHAKVPYAVLAVAVVLAILLTEWWLYHRGVI